eukprot:4172047-Amphidinium_carterae.1
MFIVGTSTIGGHMCRWLLCKYYGKPSMGIVTTWVLHRRRNGKSIPTALFAIPAVTHISLQISNKVDFQWNKNVISTEEYIGNLSSVNVTLCPYFIHGYLRYYVFNKKAATPASRERAADDDASLAEKVG